MDVRKYFLFAILILIPFTTIGSADVTDGIIYLVTDQMIYDPGETININASCKDNNRNYFECNFEIEHTYPDGTTEILPKTKTGTGCFYSSLTAVENGTHHIAIITEEDTDQIYEDEEFFIVGRRSSPDIKMAYFSSNSNLIALLITNEKEMPIDGARVLLNENTDFTDEKGYAVFYEEEKEDLRFKISKPGYASCFGELWDLTDDSTAPEIQITSLQENEVYRDTKITLAGSMNDNVQLRSAYFIVNDGTMKSMTFNEDGSFEIPVKNYAFDYGENTIEVIAYDLCGNAASKEITFRFEPEMTEDTWLFWTKRGLTSILDFLL
ncbi:MAG: hypothetical protein Q8J68_02670 [Methanolobus sp.]|jgi:hypothetical protein|uniref:hypothetical protein n=1 Tax=Methanolobus sp. TaxID=1874737 RepID=UPI002731E9E4|nr:hypothetical protein [Methanolobus sp.]MDP2216178.1 hypothetical protein [Methanolobus sp.]